MPKRRQHGVRVFHPRCGASQLGPHEKTRLASRPPAPDEDRLPEVREHMAAPIQRSWEAREFNEQIKLGVLELTHFLNTFGAPAAFIPIPESALRAN